MFDIIQLNEKLLPELKELAKKLKIKFPIELIQNAHLVSNKL